MLGSKLWPADAFLLGSPIHVNLKYNITWPYLACFSLPTNCLCWYYSNASNWNS